MQYTENQEHEDDGAITVRIIKKGKKTESKMRNERQITFKVRQEIT